MQARAAGTEPVLAQSYFEFAGDLATPEDILAFYNTARSAAQLGQHFFADSAEPRPSRFVGFATVPAPVDGPRFDPFLEYGDERDGPPPRGEDARPAEPQPWEPRGP